MTPERVKEMRELLHLMASQATVLDGYLECAEQNLPEDRHRRNRELAREAVSRMKTALGGVRQMVACEEMVSESLELFKTWVMP